MATTGARVKRQAVGLYAEVAPDAKAVVDQIHERVGGPKWAVVETLLKHVETELDDNGLPTWWPKQPTQQEALDIPA